VSWAWIVALLGPLFVARQRRRRRELGLDDALCARALELLPRILAGGAAPTRAELVRRLAARGVRLDPASQAPAHLVGYAAAHGLVCRGADGADGEPTYVLAEAWLGKRPARDREEALAELARRYLVAHGPAGERDFATWSGLPRADARRGLQAAAGGLEEVRIAGQAAWMHAPGAAPASGRRPCVRLVPAFDAYLLGYASRDAALPARFAAQIQAGGGWIHPALLADGRVLGTWRLETESAGAIVALRPFEPLARPVIDRVDEEVADIGRFLGTDARLR
jgi:hypothetical protein